MVRVRERADPGNALAVAFEVQHAGESAAVVGPAAAVGEEEVGFLGAVAGAAGEVVAAADEACARGAVVVRAECWVFVGGAFGGLDDDEAEAAAIGRLEVDGALVVRDVEALDAAGSFGDVGITVFQSEGRGVFKRCRNSAANGGEDGNAGRELHFERLLTDCVELMKRRFCECEGDLYLT